MPLTSGTSAQMRRRYRLALLLSIITGMAAVLATWVVPLRLRLGPGMNQYTVGYIPDEYAYLFESDTLLAGATSSNAYNGVGDADIIWPRFLEPLIRCFLGLSGMSVLTFFWLWRFLFPLALLFLFMLLARAALLRRARIWLWPLATVSAATCLSLLYLSYHLLWDRVFYESPKDGYVPIFFWLNRVTSNIEFLLSLLCLWLYLRFVQQPSTWRGWLLAGAGAVTLYLRPYAALPMGLSAAVGTLWLLFRRRIRPRDLLMIVCGLALLCTPFVWILRHNGQSQAYRDMVERIFLPPFAYQVHPLWCRYLIIGALVIALSRLVRASVRTVLISCALSLMGFPFIAGLISPAAKEILCANDRFTSFHLPLLLLSGLLILAHSAEAWRGRGGALRALQATHWLCGVGCTAALGVALFSATFTFAPDGRYAPAFIQRELRYHNAYEWVREHTPVEALFLVDDGLDWSKVGRSAEEINSLRWQFVFLQNDLFQIIARRRRVHCFYLDWQALTHQQLGELMTLHCGTFGYALGPQRYIDVLAKYRPEYVFWRKTPPIFVAEQSVPVPRGTLSAQLLQSATTVYEDEYCLIWQLHHP